jgi:hypothetical protein
LCRKPIILWCSRLISLQHSAANQSADNAAWQSVNSTEQSVNGKENQSADNAASQSADSTVEQSVVQQPVS